MRLRKDSDHDWGLNTTSTADISFMLLVFFLVTTSMYVDRGLLRQLPATDDNTAEQTELDIDRENILDLKLSAEGQLLVNDSVASFSTLQPTITQFVQARGNDQVLMIAADPATPYDAYIQLHQAMSKASEEARLTNPQLPQRVAENYHETQAPQE